MLKQWIYMLGHNLIQLLNCKAFEYRFIKLAISSDNFWTKS